MSGSGSLWSGLDENSTILNTTDSDIEDENTGLGVASFIMMCTLMCFILIIICCFCFMCCEDCCHRRHSITRNYNNYRFSRSSSSSSDGSDYDIESNNDSYDELEMKKIETPISIKNTSFLTMTELSKFPHAEETCAICLETFSESDEHSKVIQTECGHFYHMECIKDDSITTCPLCREPFKASHYFDLFIQL